MTTTEKIADKKAKIQKSKDRIATEQAKINKLTREIEELESLEVKGLLKELDMPFDEIKKLIIERAKKQSKSNDCLETN